MGVPIVTAGDSIEPGAPQALFAPRIVLGARDNQQGRQYDVAGDGRFLIDTELDDDVGAPIRLIQNWDGATR